MDFDKIQSDEFEGADREDTLVEFFAPIVEDTATSSDDSDDLPY